MNPELAVFDTLIRYRLEPEIYTIKLLEQFAQTVAQENKPFPIHIKLDTGMHRLGFEEKDLSELVQTIKKYPQLRGSSIFSHLAASEAPEHDVFTQTQFQRYTQSYEYIISQIGYTPVRHILNSSGITRFPSYQLDMVRLGIGMYGIDPVLGDQLQPVLQLKARISQ
ncbi:MAG: alanine racemase, partial [Bacteroidota bacterium]